ncbi:MAG: hypothetical protein AAFV93_12950, partial [Chloroflexota bacterium]
TGLVDAKMNVSVWSSYGTTIYNDYQNEPRANTIEFNVDANQPDQLIVHARVTDSDDELWFLVEHPIEVHYFGWVKAEDVRYDYDLYRCLPVYMRTTFPQSSYRIYGADS